MFEAKKSLRNKNINKTLEAASEACREIMHNELMELNICDYIYTPDEAIDELGLDEELINQLLEDYVIQILKSMSYFYEYLEELKKHKAQNLELEYTPFRELAHKNLGVARNLRIKDAEELLYVLMKKDDLEYLEVSIKALKACAIKLKPVCAYDTLNLMKIKSTF